jgi:hypothetical protein
MMQALTLKLSPPISLLLPSGSLSDKRERKKQVSLILQLYLTAFTPPSLLCPFPIPTFARIPPSSIIASSHP